MAKFIPGRIDDVDVQITWDINKLTDAVTGGIREVLEEQLPEVARRAKAKAPVDTGALRNSIDYKVDKNGKGGMVFTDTQSRGKRKDTGYGGWVEGGTLTKAPRPFLAPAVDESRDAIISAMKDRVK